MWNKFFVKTNRAQDFEDRVYKLTTTGVSCGEIIFLFSNEEKLGGNFFFLKKKTLFLMSNHKQEQISEITWFLTSFFNVIWWDSILPSVWHAPPVVLYIICVCSVPMSGSTKRLLVSLQHLSSISCVMCWESGLTWERLKES